MVDREKLFRELDALTEEEVAGRLVQNVFGTDKAPLVREWLRRKAEERRRVEVQDAAARHAEAIGVSASQARASWIGAWSMVVAAIAAAVSTLFAGYAIFRVERNVPQYAVVANDGTIQVQKNFGSFGLAVKRNDSDGPEYVLRFDREPEYFEITTRDGAVAALRQIAPHEFAVRFIGSGYGSPVVAANFKIQAF